ncbi:MAG: hypothetical protein QOE84_2783 [Actinomycetota bacterium]|jgi:hypothetical protein|nr:hypothetical protein [Actinomycetota bacterium]
MNTKHKLFGALAVAGVIAASGSAFTGTGLGNTAPATQFVGGTVSQTVTGATLAGIAYSFADAPANTLVNSIALTFTTTADGRTVAVAPAGGTGGTFTCTAVSSNASTCTFAAADTETGYLGLTGLAVTVS